ncbi:DUF2721 domain-containing protein [Halanaerobaculum tunisiense]
MLKITTPAVLFSTLSLLMAAYAVRFSAVAKLIRRLSLKIKNNNSDQPEYYRKQIFILSKRISYIKFLQFFGVLSLFCSTSTMLLLLFKEVMIATIFFSIAIILFLLALIIAAIEIYYSTKALNIKTQI